MPGVRPRISPWMVVGALAADWARRRMPDTPDSPAILQVAEADMVLLMMVVVKMGEERDFDDTRWAGRNDGKTR